MNDFKIPPISTLSGTTITNFIKILKSGRVSPQYYYKLFLTALIIIVATPFHWWESLVFYRKIRKTEFEKPPLFIIGHWRSGTTLLHYILCKDPSAGYLTTYQSLFPHKLASKWLFKTFMKMKMPRRRPSDNMELNADYPQEDEFAFSNCQPNAFYNFFYFPSEYLSFYEKAVYHKNLTDKEISSWYKSYNKLLKKALIDTKGKQLIIKNPVNTARIDKILKLYPEAKFLYIYRNPVTVFYSTQKFFKALFPTIWLSKVDHDFIDRLILDLYPRLMTDYQNQKNLIPPGNLMELRFEDFEKDPVNELKRIYNVLLNEDFDAVKPFFTSYFESLSGYSKNIYEVNNDTMNLVLKEWAHFMDLYNYKMPMDIKIKSGQVK